MEFIIIWMLSTIFIGMPTMVIYRIVKWKKAEKNICEKCVYHQQNSVRKIEIYSN
jgi:hypothetical protein